jgi:hypothetical protein
LNNQRGKDAAILCIFASLVDRYKALERYTVGIIVQSIKEKHREKSSLGSTEHSGYWSRAMDLKRGIARGAPLAIPHKAVLQKEN